MTHLLKTSWYTITGRTHQVSIKSHKNAIGQLIAAIEQKKNFLKRVNDEIDDLKSRIAKLLENKNEKATELQESGISDEELNQHTDYIHIINLHNELVTTLEERTFRSSKLNREIQRAKEDIESHKHEIKILHRNVSKLKT